MTDVSGDSVKEKDGGSGEEGGGGGQTTASDDRSLPGVTTSSDAITVTIEPIALIRWSIIIVALLIVIFMARKLYLVCKSWKESSEDEQVGESIL